MTEPDRPTRDEITGFARLFTGFVQEMQELADLPAPDQESLRDRLRDHLGTDPLELPTVSAAFPSFDLANVHLALNAWFSRPGAGHELIGVSGGDRQHFALAELLQAKGRRHGYGYGVGSVDYQRVSISVDEELDCVAFGLFLGRQGDERYAVLLRAASLEYGRPNVTVDVLAADPQLAGALLGDLPGLIRTHNVFRGKVVSFESHDFGQGVGPFRLHRRPELTRADIILPEGVLERVERQVVGVAEHREALVAAGQHLRRGVLLYGPPGTGKTHTVRYLLSRLPSFTVVLLSGTSIQYISEACALARMLQPALVVLEDCDLVAEARDFSHGSGNPLLFQVLNEMDGLAQEADVAFLLTTNRIDLLEPALSQRPGRVDLAVEVPVPDAEGRAKLLRLYGPALELSDGTVADVVALTDGTTASFAKELVRHAVLRAAEEGAEVTGETHLRSAAAELLSARDAVTRRLLGAQ